MWRAAATNRPRISLPPLLQSANLHHFLGSDEHGWGFLGDRALYHRHGKVAAYGPTLRAGDVVECELDCDAGTLRYVVNGVDWGVAFRGLSGRLFPAVSFYSWGQRVTLLPALQAAGGAGVAVIRPPAYVHADELRTALDALEAFAGAEDAAAAPLPHGFAAAAWASFSLWSRGWEARAVTRTGLEASFDASPAALAAFLRPAPGAAAAGTPLPLLRSGDPVLVHEQGGGSSGAPSGATLARVVGAAGGRLWVVPQQPPPVAGSESPDEPPLGAWHLGPGARVTPVAEAAYADDGAGLPAAALDAALASPGGAGGAGVEAEQWRSAAAVFELEERLRPSGAMRAAWPAGAAGSLGALAASSDADSKTPEEADAWGATTGEGLGGAAAAPLVAAVLAAVRRIPSARAFAALACDPAALRAAGWAPAEHDAAAVAGIDALCDRVKESPWAVPLERVVADVVLKLAPRPGERAAAPAPPAFAGLWPASDVPTAAAAARLAFGVVGACRVAVLRALNDRARTLLPFADFTADLSDAPASDPLALPLLAVVRAATGAAAAAAPVPAASARCRATSAAYPGALAALARFAPCVFAHTSRGVLRSVLERTATPARRSEDDYDYPEVRGLQGRCDRRPRNSDLAVSSPRRTCRASL